MKQKLKRILACVLVLCMGFGVQSNLVWAQENDDVIVQENVTDYTSNMTDDTDTTDDTTGATTDDTKNTDTTGIEEVVFKGAVTEIGTSAFQECKSLKEIQLPNTITTIGAQAFMNCNDLTKIALPAVALAAEDEPTDPTDNEELSGYCGAEGNEYNVTWTLTPTGDKVSVDNEEKDSYILTISGAGAMADLDVTGVNNADTPQSEWKTDTRPWKDYIYQITKVVIDEGVTSVGKRSLKCARNLEELILPDSLEIIGYQAFHYCSNLKTINGLGASIHTIMQSAFQGIAIEAISIPGNVKTIAPYAFLGCANLSSVNLESGIEKIENQAFAMTAIQKIEIPDSVSTIGTAVFYMCKNLESVVLPKTLTNISSQLFQFSALKRVEIPDTITSIGANAFRGTGLLGIFIPESVTKIEKAAFTSNGGATENFTIYFQQASQLNLLSTVPGMENYTPAVAVLAVTNGGTFADDTVFEQGKLAVPSKSGSIFDGWYTKDGTNNDWGDKVTVPTTGKTYYAKWIELKDQSISMEYGSTKELPTVSGVTLSEWTSADESVAKVENGKIKTVNAGKTTLTAKASTASGGTATFTVNVEVTPMSIIYGSPDKTEDGRPYIVYSLNEDGTAPKISDILGFYPVKEKQGESGYEADTSKPKITLNPSMGADGDVEYTYVNDVSNNKITTDTLPTHPTVDENGNPHSIRVEMKLKNPNYRFTTIGTNWQQGDTITLFVTCYEEGMNEVDMYLEGESKPLKIFEEQVYEYTGQGVVPTTKDLTTLYTKGKNTSNTITKFTAHFHAVAEDTKFAGSHLEQVTNDQLTKEALEKIAPKELGVYSFVINGYNKDTKTYSYVSRRYSIVKGKPTGNPVFDVIESGKSLSEVQLSGTMKNKIGETVAGTFTWEDGNQTVESGKAYKWTFTPDDTNHYEVVNGESIVCPIPMEELNAIPTINASDKTLTVGDTFNPLEGVTASDKEDGDITEKVEVLSNDVDTSKAGTYTVIYKVTDSKGASSTKTITVTVKAKDTQNPTTDDSKKPSATDTDKKPASTDKQTTSNSPKTGDSTNMTTWLALMFVSLGLLAGVFTVRKSRKSR